MKENIETKDVQRTEYLDKNGLDMLWTKVKENTHNQVEVERNRATTQENIIIETKADKSELHSSYVSNSTFTALQEKVAANTDAIRDKQDAGNYLSYKTLNNEGYYEIPDIRIPGSAGSTKTDIDSQSISVNCDYPASHTTITCDGISNTDNNANHVYATDGSIADLTQYALSSTLAALEQKVTDNTAAISGKQNAGKYMPYEKYVFGHGYDLPYNNDFWVMKTADKLTTSTQISPSRVIIHNPQGDIYIGDNETEHGVSVDHDYKIHSLLNYDSLIIYMYIGNERHIGAKLSEEGVTLFNGDDNHVLTSYGSTIDITQYAKKSELPTVPTKVSQLQNDSNFTTNSYVTQNFAGREETDNKVVNLQNTITQLGTNKQDKIIPGNINISALNSQNTIVALKNTIMELINTLEKSKVITVTRN